MKGITDFIKDTSKLEQLSIIRISLTKVTNNIKYLGGINLL